tara:strand:+ start:777 stop:1166 length:390 start_codon:yes stop_codon:yes gene_type:complete
MGLQVPVILLVEVVVKNPKEVPAQIGGTCVNVGVTIGFTVMISVTIVADWPIAGVNVYVVVVILSNAGVQVPMILLVDLIGNGDNVPPTQIAATGENVGVTIVCPKPLNAQANRYKIKMFFKLVTYIFV